ncbi:MAG: oleate hydratase [Parafilimonas sp.]
MHQNLKAFIIGSGIAGIASAIRLAVQGFRVTVFEKNSIAGGKIDLIEKANYCFDSGPSLFTHPQYIEDLFALTNEKIENYFSYKPVEIACKYFYEDGTVINAYANAEKLKKELEEKTGEPKENIRRYLKSSEKAYSNIGNIFLNYSLHKRKTVRRVSVLKALISIKPSLIFSSLNELNTRSFSKPQTIQLFNRYATYNGSNPYTAPAMLSVIPHLEYNEGIFYPQGGMISIIHSLYRLAVKMGVTFQFNSPVQYIIVHEQMAIGIVVNDENHFADAVISNGDLYFTYKQLLQDEKKAQKILKQERSSSTIIFYWGMKKEFPQLQLHNIFFSKNYKEEFDFIFKRRQLYHDPTV